MTFKEVYLNNVVWQPDTILRIIPPHQLQNCTRFPFENFFEFFGTKSST